MARSIEITRTRDASIVMLRNVTMAEALKEAERDKGTILPLTSILRLLQEDNKRSKIVGLFGTSLWTDNGGITEGRYLVRPDSKLIPVYNGEWKGVGINRRLRVGNTEGSDLVMLDVPGMLAKVMFNHMVVGAVDPNEKLNALVKLRR